MKPGIINLAKLNRAQRKMLFEWASANGVRHYVPLESHMVITGTSSPWKPSTSSALGRRTRSGRVGSAPGTCRVVSGHTEFGFRFGHPSEAHL
ncbi:hypothetical protein [Glutamicibacter protophormiae]|uniref:hypothetical protein n=1 Tax=Glutamicibacter protophormiae TaxID=37930 RepID=UPI00360E8813